MIMRSRRLWIPLSALTAAVIALALVLTLGAPGVPDARAHTTHVVQIGDDWYCDSTHTSEDNPCVTNISMGDQVFWIWESGNAHNHSSTSDDGSSEIWDSGIQSSPFAFDRFFDTAGSFSYHCEVHPGMHGTIIVSSTPAATDVHTPTDTPGGPTSTPTPPAVVGDANGDGQVNSIDAALVLQYSANLITSISFRGDANLDYSINAIDATLILQFAAGLLSQLPP
jgi:plastocyanin